MIITQKNSMDIFKKSAIEILKKTGMPLHYSEITRLALETGILETEDATPEAIINAQIITVDIKNKTGYGTYPDNAHASI